MRMNRSMSKAFICVVNGRAAAPPCTVCSIGVSTSMKSWLSKVRRSEATALERLRTMLRMRSSAIMPRYGLRVRVSSLSSLCKAGSGCSALAAMAHSEANTDSSPVLEAITRPLMNRWSPRSTSCLNCFSESAPISFLEIMPWMVVPSPADSCTKHRPPALRRNSTRPAMPTTSSVSWPASSLPS